MGQRLHLQLFRNHPVLSKFLQPGAQEFSRHEGGDRVATASPCPLAVCPWLAVVGLLSPACVAAQLALCWSGSSWAETHPPRLILPVHVSTRPACCVLAPANESDYVVLPHLPESPGSFPRAREPRRVIGEGPCGDWGS